MFTATKTAEAASQKTCTTSSRPHDPIVTLASETIRSAFGPMVQVVGDCLQCHGSSSGMTLAMLRHHIPPHVATVQIRAALLVLLQHNIVTLHRQKAAAAVSTNSNSMSTSSSTKRKRKKGGPPAVIYLYSYHPLTATYIPRYAKFIEYIHKGVDAVAACSLQTLLQQGRLRTVDWVVQAAERAPKSEKYTSRQSVLDAVGKLVHGGFVIPVPTLDSLESEGGKEGDDPDEGEFQFGDSRAQPQPPPTKRVKLEFPMPLAEAGSVPDQGLYQDEDPAVIALLQAHAGQYKEIPVDAVWRVNVALFHENLRAFHLGKLVSERHGGRVQSAGSLVTAALRFRAHVHHSSSHRNPHQQQQVSHNYESTTFTVQDIIKYLPKPVVQLFEKKTGGLVINLNTAWSKLSTLQSPPLAVRRVGEDRYEIAVQNLVQYLHDRIVYQLVHDRHGGIAARCHSILSNRGYLESDRLAEMAMVPARDVREVLHHLYRSRYIELMTLSQGRGGSYNPAHSIFLWGVERPRLVQRVTEHTATALWHVRQRRAHEVQVGRAWMERAQREAEEGVDATDAEDERAFQKFQLGLERLDVAALQLDETLMAMCDFLVVQT